MKSFPGTVFDIIFLLKFSFFVFFVIADTLVGRHVQDEEDIIRFELLTPEEESVIVPKLEEMCQEDLEANGLTFPSLEEVPQ